MINWKLTAVLKLFSLHLGSIKDSWLLGHGDSQIQFMIKLISGLWYFIIDSSKPKFIDRCYYTNVYYWCGLIYPCK